MKSGTLHSIIIDFKNDSIAYEGSIVPGDPCDPCDMEHQRQHIEAPKHIKSSSFNNPPLK